jgi:hypothetical protein
MIKPLLIKYFHRRYILLTAIAFTFAIALITSASASDSDIPIVTVKQVNDEIYVTTYLKPSARFKDEINNGISKDIIFYIDLFKIWNIWPDEFIKGKKIIKTLKSDPIKREYVAVSIEEYVHKEKRFKDPESMIEWAFNIREIKLANIKELETGHYFVKVTVESRLKKLPPVIGQMLFFVPEKEFKIYRESTHFHIEQR